MATPLITRIEREDVEDTLNPRGWLTDTAIRTIINYYGNTSPSSHITFVNPTWLGTWERMGRVLPDPLPAFLTGRNQGGHRPVGLAIPFNEDNGHWTTIYVNLEARGAIYFNSLPSWGSRRAEEVMHAFFERFELFFQGTGPFRFEVDDRCATQNNLSSCSIYTIRNTLDLMDHRRPDWKALSREEEGNFRRNAAFLLESNLGALEIPASRREGKGNTAPDQGGPKSPPAFGAWPYNFYNGKAAWGTENWDTKPKNPKKKIEDEKWINW
ncbi:uncharacterized protein LY89DRAFT_673516 [Mollisia scopiformis]|uniref:Ubiquitin-like protease family profile domain-containing protein n=1 Tax=Mollisia scopiformis TaxID=149040 RepID=A0A194WX50_MOLSC|nr:uncharacterized protein LY89DRAFT_673516 [Mollisia scopiformis]KUJ12558.1 hypothetical protein LY89DRAFT_673516 [Mollisia scopiformis]